MSNKVIDVIFLLRPAFWITCVLRLRHYGMSPIILNCIANCVVWISCYMVSYGYGLATALWYGTNNPQLCCLLNDWTSCLDWISCYGMVRLRIRQLVATVMVWLRLYDMEPIIRHSHHLITTAMVMATAVWCGTNNNNWKQCCQLSGLDQLLWYGTVNAPSIDRYGYGLATALWYGTNNQTQCCPLSWLNQLFCYGMIGL
ncbi:unnamed protein product [Ceratitis capitata]|uniref:(Mediterranean fruit fly) hypothetical protein n=1 Tax=Ceratitis capitata TaxID=7213 RepID=A0A811VM90_CERCA|nr:unnamed protein product [Ceratitis capitata]